MNQKELFEVFSCGVAEYAKRADGRIREKQVCAFFPLRGKKYSHDLMIVGRATNGWLDKQHKAEKTNDSSAVQLGDVSKRQTFLDVIRAESLSDDPMFWVLEEWNGKDYQAWRSAFWRVAKKSLLSLNSHDALDSDWPSHLIWSNLYKVGPEKGGNPGVLMRRAQEDWCVEMLKHEIEIFEPKKILFMTGNKGWAEFFFDKMEFVDSKLLCSQLVERSGYFRLSDSDNPKVVVVPHPQGKPEMEMVEQVLDRFKSLA